MGGGLCGWGWCGGAQSPDLPGLTLMGRAGGGQMEGQAVLCSGRTGRKQFSRRSGEMAGLLQREYLSGAPRQARPGSEP